MLIRGAGVGWGLAWGVALLCGAAAPAGVVLNELMYHPASDNDAEEFIELFNAGRAAVDLSGWCLEGVDFCFPPGASLAAGEYLVLARDAAACAARYGVAPAYVYPGKLSNSGETLSLRDAGGALLERVTYSDQPPWSPLADGEGPSLERVAVALEIDSPRNWRACTAPAQHSCGAPNSVAASAWEPWVDTVSFALAPLPDEALLVTAAILDADSAQLAYRLGFGAEEVLPLADDGAHGDGAAGDGVYGVTIPGQPANTLVRFRIEATGATGTGRYPRSDDTTQYTGTAVQDPGLETALPVFHWYIEPADYADALAHKFTDLTEPAVLVQNGVLFDNVQVRVRGNMSRYWPKNHWKFKLPRGHKLTAPHASGVVVDELDLQCGYSDKTFVREILGHETFRDAGAPHSIIFPIRLHQNGEFFGLYAFCEPKDPAFLARNGLDTEGAWYKSVDGDCRVAPPAELLADYEKRTREYEDYSDLQALLTAINTLTGPALHAYLLDNINVPDALNYIAINSIIHNNDHMRKNFYLYRDTEGTGRWSMQAHDLDLTFGRNFNGQVLNDVIWANVDAITNRPLVSPSHPLFGDDLHQKYDYLWNRFIDRVLDDPQLRAMYFRRLRTLADTLLAPGRFEARIDELAPLIAPETVLDRERWGWYGAAQTPAEAVEFLKNEYLAVRRIHLLETHRVAGEIPEPQSATPPIVINEIMYAPAGGATQAFVELHNPAAEEAVDLSGWRLNGVSLTLPAGAVLLPGEYALVVENDAEFRSAYGGGRLVLAQYDGTLSPTGEELVLRDAAGALIDRVPYDSVAPWPAEAAGGGASLELVDATRDNSRAAYWAASVVPGGTPGAPNSTAGSLPDLPYVVINEVLPVNVGTLADEQGEFDPWIELYNDSDATVELGGMFLSDDPNVPDRWMIPAGTYLCPRAWLLIWADSEPGDGPLHAGFALGAAGGAVVLFTAEGYPVDYLGYPASGADVPFGRYPDAAFGTRVLHAPTPAAANVALTAPLILNEYNAVDSDKFLKDGGADTFWGRVLGNGGDWFELVVTVDHVDARGWEIVISNDTGGGGQTIEVLTLTDAPLWADLRRGTVITISEQLADDVSFDPATGDWWINVQAASGAPGTYITSENFKVSNNNWQLTVRDSTGLPVFGPAGEGISPPSGIGGDEVCQLQADPDEYTTPLADYGDSARSTFGAANVYAGGTLMQDFAPLRRVVGVCTDANECDDGDDCTSDACVDGVCTFTPLPACYSLRLTTAAQACAGGTLTALLETADLPQPVRAIQVLLAFEEDHLTLGGVAPGDGLGSPWDAATLTQLESGAGWAAIALELPGPGAAVAAVAARLQFAVGDVGGAAVTFADECVPLATGLRRASDGALLAASVTGSDPVTINASPIALTCPAPLTFTCLADMPGPALTAAEFVAAGGTIETGGEDVTFAFAGETVSLDACGGTVERTYILETASGCRAECVQTLVADNAGSPMFTTMPEDIVLYAPEPRVVTYDTPTAVDSCGAPAVMNCSPPSGAVFPLGTTVVTCTATDVCGNVGETTFNVTLIEGDAIAATVVLPDIAAPEVIRRCITFRLRDASGCAASTTLPVSFSGVPATAAVVLGVPPGAWEVVCAKDEARTTWSSQALAPTALGFEAVAPLTLLGGDTDNDGDVDADDLAFVVARLGGAAAATACPWDGARTADVNGDGAVRADDYTFVFVNWLQAGTCPCEP